MQDLFLKKAQEGLVDVKVTLNTLSSLDKETVFKEVLALYNAVDSGKASTLDFNDSRNN